MGERTPWRLQTRHHGASDTREVIIQEGQREVLRIDGDNWDISDFTLMVCAVNSHEELLAAAKNLRFFWAHEQKFSSEAEEESFDNAWEDAYEALSDAIARAERSES